MAYGSTVRSARPHSTTLRNTCTVAAILGFGVITGALLAETSLMSFRLARPSVVPRLGGASTGLGWTVPVSSPGQSRRPYHQRRSAMPHHVGV